MSTIWLVSLLENVYWNVTVIITSKLTISPFVGTVVGVVPPTLLLVDVMIVGLGTDANVVGAMEGDTVGTIVGLAVVPPVVLVLPVVSEVVDSITVGLAVGAVGRRVVGNREGLFVGDVVGIWDGDPEGDFEGK